MGIFVPKWTYLGKCTFCIYMKAIFPFGYFPALYLISGASWSIGQLDGEPYSAEWCIQHWCMVCAMAEFVLFVFFGLWNGWFFFSSLCFRFVEWVTISTKEKLEFNCSFSAWLEKELMTSYNKKTATTSCHIVGKVLCHMYVLGSSMVLRPSPR